ncbi:MAG TPA: tyrosine-type recombinase/integrase [Chitinophagaceae bacterium]|nr:tyrosine-type recombinase/integrase [Chitinophagaceae bacterium]
MKKTTPQLLLVEQFSQFVKVSARGRRLTPSGKRIARGTIMNYRYVQLLLNEFEQKNHRQLRIQLLHRASMRLLQRERNYWARFFNQFSVFLYREKKYCDHYVLNVFKALKTFFNYLQQERGLMTGNYHKSFRVPLQQSTPVVLTPEQLRFLITNREFEQSLNPFVRRARDIFVFGCTVALRVSDLMKLKKTNLIKTENETFLSLFTEKTGAEVRIPLPDYALEIVFRNRRKAGKYLLPRLSSANLNVQVKRLIQLAGWDYTVPKNRSYKGKMEEIKTESGKTWPFYRHITAHTMRRTAITTLLIMGVPENVVRKISGHAPGSKEFYKYVGIADEYLNQEVKKAYQKLVATPILPTIETGV